MIRETGTDALQRTRYRAVEVLSRYLTSEQISLLTWENVRFEGKIVRISYDGPKALLLSSGAATAISDLSDIDQGPEGRLLGLSACGIRSLLFRYRQRRRQP